MVQLGRRDPHGFRRLGRPDGVPVGRHHRPTAVGKGLGGVEAYTGRGACDQNSSGAVGFSHG